MGLARTVVAALVVAVWVGGCVDRFGTGGTGEMVVPRETLRRVDGVQLKDLSKEPPQTMPATLATQPTTQPAPTEVKLTIEEARQAALKNNLDLKVELFNPAIAKERISEEQARFEWLFTTNIDYSKTDSPSFSRLNATQNESWGVTPGLQLPLQTGGTVNLALPMTRNETNNEFATLNPAYTSDYLLSLSQPLARGAGFSVNAQGIRAAFYGYQQSELRTKIQVIAVLANVDRAYWRLYAARRFIEVRRQQYDLSVAQLERAKRMLAQGSVPEVEVRRAESAVADQIEALIIAENDARNVQRDLKRILNLPDVPMNTATVLIPTTPPNVFYYKLEPHQLVQAAIKQRMEMLEVELQLAEQASNIFVARNALLPLVSLDYQYRVNGLGQTLSGALGMAGNNDFGDHTVGLRLEVPLGNEAAKSRLRQALASRMQSLATKDQRTAAITQEVLNALDALEAGWQRIYAARQRTVLNQRLYDTEARLFAQGLNTSTDVLNAQLRLGDAATSELSAITQYQIFQVDIAFATGNLLGASGVVWEPVKTR